MNIFEKKLQASVVEALPLNPIELYQTCPYKEGFGYLRGIQEEVLNLWHANRTQRDTICKMNTGSGKTLTGLLMLYSKMIEKVGPSLYVCPDNQLLDQTLQFAEDYGIPVCTFGNPSVLPSDFLNAKSILVCNFHKLFNGKSIFNRDNVQIGAVLIDDAHKCVDIAREQCTITFSRKHPVAEKLFNLFADSLKHQSAGGFIQLAGGDSTVTMRVPYWTWFEYNETVIKIINDYVIEIDKDGNNTESIKFNWNLIVNNMLTYDCFIGGNTLEIAPIHVPYHEVPAYNEAKFRYILSATFEDDYDLIKDLGIAYNSVLAPIVPGDRKDVGKRLILSPRRYDSRLSDEQIRNFIATYPPSGYNTIILVASDAGAEAWKNIGAVAVKKENIHDAITKLKNSKNNFMVFVNRYDGIDLYNDLCRILVIDGLPKYYSLQEEYTEIRLDSLKAGKKAQIIEQGLGRATRSGSDHSVIFLMGLDLMNFLGLESNLSHFTPVTKTQINLGLKLLDGERSSDSLKTINDTASYCLTNHTSWHSYHTRAILAISNTEIDADRKHILFLAETERRALEVFRLRRYEDAANIILNEIVNQDNISAKEKAWYYQLGAQLMYLGNKVVSNNLQIKACNMTTRMFHPQNQHIYKKLSRKTVQAAAINKRLKEFERAQDIVNHIEEILMSLKYDETLSHRAFEASLADVGRFLGFAVQMPERDSGDGPDGLWCLSDDHFLILEAKSRATHDAISRDNIEQLLHSELWFKDQYPNAEYSLITLQNSNKKGTKVHIPDNARVLDKDSLELLHTNLRQFANALQSHQPGNHTDDEISQLLVAYKLTTDLFRQTYLKIIK